MQCRRWRCYCLSSVHNRSLFLSVHLSLIICCESHLVVTCSAEHTMEEESFWQLINSTSPVFNYRLRSSNRALELPERFHLMSFWFNLSVFSIVCHQALHRDLQNITQQVNCLLSFVPLRKLTEALNGENILRDISLYRDINWSPQQVHVLRQLTFFWELFSTALIWQQQVPSWLTKGRKCYQPRSSLPLICNSLGMLQMILSGY